MKNELTKELFFKGIDCPNCASKIEHLLNNDENIIEARINFLSKKIIITYFEGINIIELIETIANKIENDVKISEVEEEHYECCHHHEEHYECCHHHEEHYECCHHHEEHHECCHHHEEHHECCLHHEEHYHEHEKDKKVIKKRINVPLIIGCVLTIVAVVFKTFFDNDVLNVISRGFFIVAYILIAYKIIFKSFKNIRKGNIFDENLLMMIASIGALIIDEGLEAVLVVLLYTIGEYFQDKALGNSTNAIASLTKLKVDHTTLGDGQIIKTNQVKVGDEIIIKVGERIPLDGVIISGKTSIDTKVLTGESLPKDVKVGDEILSGCINLTGVITVKVTKLVNESTASKIIKMVELASNKKSHTEEFITKFARVYTPIVLVLALIVFLVEWVFIDTFTIYDALNNCFVFLVTSCPCALVISIPLAFFGGIGKCSSYGVLVKGGNYIEALSKTKVICFDKTGTLTKGNFAVKEVKPALGVDFNLLIDYLVAVETYSNHPIALSICGLKPINQELEITDVKELSGYGMIAKINNIPVIVGNEKLMIKENIEFIRETNPGSVIYLAYNGQYLGSVLIVDEIKEESYLMISELKKQHITSHMLTGDNKDIALNVGEKLGIDYVKAELLPDDKLKLLESIIESKEKNTSVVYVGDGINDTPAIKLADVGVAIGGFGNDEAVEVSDVVLMSDKMNNLVKAIKTAKFTKNILIQNISFALIVKFLALVIGTIGILGSFGMLLGVFADVGVCLIAILNTLRILKHGEK